VVVKLSKITMSKLEKYLVLWTFFIRIMSGSVLLHRQLSPEGLQNFLLG
jgi:hypothetical protein